MAKISFDNGCTYYSANGSAEAWADSGLFWSDIVNYMADDIREAVHQELSPCTPAEFLRRYLELSPVDLVIG